MEPAINTTIPAVREFAFGSDSTINPINEDSSSTVLNYDSGFPRAFSNPNGKKVLIGDVNAVGFLATSEQWYRQCGGIHSYNKKFSEKVGGYPNGIVLDYFSPSQQKLRRVMSLVDNNTWNFNANYSDGDEKWIDNIHWAYCDKYAYSAKAFSVSHMASQTIEFNSKITQQLEVGYDVEVNMYVDALMVTGTASSSYRNEWGVHIQAPAGSTYNSSKPYNKVLTRYNGSNFTMQYNHAHYWLKAGSKISPYFLTQSLSTLRYRICIETARTGYATDDAS